MKYKIINLGDVDVNIKYEYQISNKYVKADKKVGIIVGV